MVTQIVRHKITYTKQSSIMGLFLILSFLVHAPYSMGMKREGGGGEKIIELRIFRDDIERLNKIKSFEECMVSFCNTLPDIIECIINFTEVGEIRDATKKSEDGLKKLEDLFESFISAPSEVEKLKDCIPRWKVALVNCKKEMTMYHECGDARIDNITLDKKLHEVDQKIEILEKKFSNEFVKWKEVNQKTETLEKKLSNILVNTPDLDLDQKEAIQKQKEAIQKEKMEKGIEFDSKCIDKTIIKSDLLFEKARLLDDICDCLIKTNNVLKNISKERIIRPVAEVGKKGEGIENKEEMGEE